MTEAERERYVILAEEASEIAQAVMKILRHGTESVNPYDPKAITNLQHLCDEIVDMSAVIHAMVKKYDFDLSHVDAEFLEKRWEKKLRFMHHQ